MLEQKNADTPVEGKQIPPQKNPSPDTPANNESADNAQKQEEEFVKIPKNELERWKAKMSTVDKMRAELEKEKARLAKARRKAKLAKERVFSFEEPEEEPEPTEDELALITEKETLKVEKGVLGILKSDEYSKLLEADPTLREILENNPLGLPVFKELPIDAEDALYKIEEYLSERAAKLPVDESGKKEPETPPAPEAGPTNPPTDVQQKVEEKKEKTSGPKSVNELENDIFNTIMGGNQ